MRIQAPPTAAITQSCTKNGWRNASTTLAHQKNGCAMHGRPTATCHIFNTMDKRCRPVPAAMAESTSTTSERMYLLVVVVVVVAIHHNIITLLLSL